MQELRNGGKTIILITHKLEEIKKIADRCAVLNRGRLIGVLDVPATTTKEMASLMVGREVLMQVEKREGRFGNTVLEAKGLTVRNENKFEVVRNVSFSIREGEIFAIAGVSGNGQVEIADAVAGLTKAAQGQILLNGRDITHYGIRRRSLAGISYIPEDRQTYGLVLDFLLEENLALKSYFCEPFSSGGVLRPESFAAYADKLIGKYDIRCGRGAKTAARSMSGGNQQKAIVARELELDCPLMIFVQPTRGLDIGAIENIRNQILRERDKGKAILLVSLELDEVMMLADTIGVIYNGELLNIADAGDMTPQEVGKYMMGVVEA